MNFKKLHSLFLVGTLVFPATTLPLHLQRTVRKKASQLTSVIHHQPQLYTIPKRNFTGGEIIIGVATWNVLKAATAVATVSLCAYFAGQKKPAGVPQVDTSLPAAVNNSAEAAKKIFYEAACGVNKSTSDRSFVRQLASYLSPERFAEELGLKVGKESQALQAILQQEAVALAPQAVDAYMGTELLRALISDDSSVAHNEAGKKALGQLALKVSPEEWAKLFNRSNFKAYHEHQTYIKKGLYTLGQKVPVWPRRFEQIVEDTHSGRPMEDILYAQNELKQVYVPQEGVVYTPEQLHAQKYFGIPFEPATKQTTDTATQVAKATKAAEVAQSIPQSLEQVSEPVHAVQAAPTPCISRDNAEQVLAPTQATAQTVPVVTPAASKPPTATAPTKAPLALPQAAAQSQSWFSIPSLETVSKAAKDSFFDATSPSSLILSSAKITLQGTANTEQEFKEQLSDDIARNTVKGFLTKGFVAGGGALLLKLGVPIVIATNPITLVALGVGGAIAAHKIIDSHLETAKLHKQQRAQNRARKTNPIPQNYSEVTTAGGPQLDPKDPLEKIKDNLEKTAKNIKRVYERNPKHHRNAGPGISPEPLFPHESIQAAIPFVSGDEIYFVSLCKSGKFIDIFAPHVSKAKWHGYSVEVSELLKKQVSRQAFQTLSKAGLVKSKGTPELIKDVAKEWIKKNYGK